MSQLQRDTPSEITLRSGVASRAATPPLLELSLKLLPGLDFSPLARAQGRENTERSHQALGELAQANIGHI